MHSTPQTFAHSDAVHGVVVDIMLHVIQFGGSTAPQNGVTAVREVFAS